jgi:hypothetical protein
VLCLLQVTPTLALYDSMQYVRSPTATVCYGMCLGMGGFLLTAGGEKVRDRRLRHHLQGHSSFPSGTGEMHSCVKV